MCQPKKTLRLQMLAADICTLARCQVTQAQICVPSVDHSGSSKHFKTPKTQTALQAAPLENTKSRFACMIFLTSSLLQQQQQCERSAFHRHNLPRLLAGSLRACHVGSQSQTRKQNTNHHSPRCFFDVIEYVYLTYILKQKKRKVDGVRWRGMWSSVSTVVMFHFSESWLKETRL